VQIARLFCIVNRGWQPGYRRYPCMSHSVVYPIRFLSLVWWSSAHPIPTFSEFTRKTQKCEL